MVFNVADKTCKKKEYYIIYYRKGLRMDEYHIHVKVNTK